MKKNNIYIYFFFITILKRSQPRSWYCQTTTFFVFLHISPIFFCSSEATWSEITLSRKGQFHQILLWNPAVRLQCLAELLATVGNVSVSSSILHLKPDWFLLVLSRFRRKYVMTHQLDTVQHPFQVDLTLYVMSKKCFGAIVYTENICL